MTLVRSLTGLCIVRSFNHWCFIHRWFISDPCLIFSLLCLAAYLSWIQFPGGQSVQTWDWYASGSDLLAGDNFQCDHRWWISVLYMRLLVFVLDSFDNCFDEGRGWFLIFVGQLSYWTLHARLYDSVDPSDCRTPILWSVYCLYGLCFLMVIMLTWLCF